MPRTGRVAGMTGTQCRGPGKHQATDGENASRPAIQPGGEVRDRHAGQSSAYEPRPAARSSSLWIADRSVDRPLDMPAERGYADAAALVGAPEPVAAGLGLVSVAGLLSAFGSLDDAAARLSVR